MGSCQLLGAAACTSGSGSSPTRKKSSSASTTRGATSCFEPVASKDAAAYVGLSPDSQATQEPCHSAPVYPLPTEGDEQRSRRVERREWTQALRVGRTSGTMWLSRPFAVTLKCGCPGGFQSTSQHRFWVEVAMRTSGFDRPNCSRLSVSPLPLAQGMSNSEACRAVGIIRWTGTRWRYGRTVCSTAGEAVHYPAVCTLKPTKPQHPRYPSLVERTMMRIRRRRLRRSITRAGWWVARSRLRTGWIAYIGVRPRSRGTWRA